MKLLRNVLHCIKETPERTLDILDSFSDNQFTSKKPLLDSLESNGIIEEDSIVLILGSWYGSILIEHLAPRVKKIIAIDKDDDTVKIGKEFFKHYSNIVWITADVCNDIERTFYEEATLLINTSCEHMEDMKKWDKWKTMKRDFNKNPLYLALQSNNMFDIETHINCVNNINEFKDQLPFAFWIQEESIEDTRGTRFMLIGQYHIEKKP